MDLGDDVFFLEGGGGEGEGGGGGGGAHRRAQTTMQSIIRMGGVPVAQVCGGGERERQ